MEDKNYASYLSENGFILDWCDYVEHTDELRRETERKVEQWIQTMLPLEI